MTEKQLARLIVTGQTGLPADRPDIRDQAMQQARPDRPGLAAIRDQTGLIWLISPDRILAAWSAIDTRPAGRRNR